MRFQPRYSLLPLLALTAVVAVGVKFWKGPHHVVETTSSASELEYTYTRDWQGNRVIQGVQIQRSWNCLSGEDYRSELNYFRAGVDTGNVLFIHAHPANSNRGSSSTYCGKTLPLSAQETQELQAAREAERLHYKSLGMVPD